MQPFGTVGKAPLQPAGALVEAPDQEQQFVTGGIDAGRESNDGAIEFVDGMMALGGSFGRGHDTSQYAGEGL
jgi:hypothetical protein